MKGQGVDSGLRTQDHRGMNTDLVEVDDKAEDFTDRDQDVQGGTRDVTRGTTGGQVHKGTKGKGVSGQRERTGSKDHVPLHDRTGRGRPILRGSPVRP